MKQFSPACERNQQPILDVLREILPEQGVVLEIGSGTGQHVAYFAGQLPQLTWQPTDLPENLDSVRAWREESGTGNINEPLVLDLLSDNWPIAQADVVICINAIHIVSWQGVKNLFAGVGRLLNDGGVFYVYGPYRYAHRPLEPSNQQFDQWLKAHDPASGIRDFEAVNELAAKASLTKECDQAMPANNRSIWWRKQWLV